MNKLKKLLSNLQMRGDSLQYSEVKIIRTRLEVICETMDLVMNCESDQVTLVGGVHLEWIVTIDALESLWVILERDVEIHEPKGLLDYHFMMVTGDKLSITFKTLA